MLWEQNLSLFSPLALSERENRGLLIQFLLFELLESYQSVISDRPKTLFTTIARFFPYDWGSPIGSLNKLMEHTYLLKTSFPDKLDAVTKTAEAILKVIHALSSTEDPAKEPLIALLQEIFTSLEPFIHTCKEDENLIFLILKNHPLIDKLNYPGYSASLLLKIHPCGSETLGEKMCDKYHRRGFVSQISEFKLLLTELLHA